MNSLVRTFAVTNCSAILTGEASCFSVFFGGSVSLVRRVISLLLVPALLANQAAMCLSHVHLDPANDGHATRSHVHFSHGSHEHHGHDHGEEIGSNDDSGKPESDGWFAELKFSACVPASHDADALYVVDQTTMRNSFRVVVLEGSLDSFFVQSFECLPPADKSFYCRDLRIAGPYSPRPCAIYLQTHSLLI